MGKLTRIASALLMFLALTSGAGTVATAQNLDAEELVIKSEYTMKRMWDHPEFSVNIRHYLRQAKGIVIVPTLYKGGFFIGGEGGSGVLMARGPNNEWSYPSFLTLGSASFGLQFGGQASELILIIMTGQGLDAILKDQVKIGGEISGALGPYGSGASASTTTNMDADVIAYSIAKGAFIGMNVEGTALIPRESHNREYYGQNVTPRQIVLDGAVGNAQADSLRQTLKTFMTQQ